MRLAIAILILAAAPACYAGVVFGPAVNTDFTPGQTVSFELSVTNAMGSDWVNADTIRGPVDAVAFTISSAGTGTSPSFAPAFADGKAGSIPGNQWVELLDGVFNYGGLSVGGITIMDGQTETFGKIDVVIPADFEGTFDLTLVEDVRINDNTLFNIDLTDSWSGDSNAALAGTAYNFSVTPVPEPTSFLMLGLIGLLCSGRKYFRRLG